MSSQAYLQHYEEFLSSSQTSSSQSADAVERCRLIVDHAYVSHSISDDMFQILDPSFDEDWNARTGDTLPSFDDSVEINSSYSADNSIIRRVEEEIAVARKAALASRPLLAAAAEREGTTPKSQRLNESSILSSDEDMREILNTTTRSDIEEKKSISSVELDAPETSFDNAMTVIDGEFGEATTLPRSRTRNNSTPNSSRQPIDLDNEQDVDVGIEITADDVDLQLDTSQHEGSTDDIMSKSESSFNEAITQVERVQKPETQPATDRDHDTKSKTFVDDVAVTAQQPEQALIAAENSPAVKFQSEAQVNEEGITDITLQHAVEAAPRPESTQFIDRLREYISNQRALEPTLPVSTKDEKTGLDMEGQATGIDKETLLKATQKQIFGPEPQLFVETQTKVDPPGEEHSKLNSAGTDTRPKQWSNTPLSPSSSTMWSVFSHEEKKADEALGESNVPLMGSGLLVAFVSSMVMNVISSSHGLLADDSPEEIRLSSRRSYAQENVAKGLSDQYVPTSPSGANSDIRPLSRPSCTPGNVMITPPSPEFPTPRDGNPEISSGTPIASDNNETRRTNHHSYTPHHAMIRPPSPFVVTASDVNPDDATSPRDAIGNNAIMQHVHSQDNVVVDSIQLAPQPSTEPEITKLRQILDTKREQRQTTRRTNHHSYTPRDAMIRPPSPCVVTASDVNPDDATSPRDAIGNNAIMQHVHSQDNVVVDSIQLGPQPSTEPEITKLRQILDTKREPRQTFLTTLRSTSRVFEGNLFETATIANRTSHGAADQFLGAPSSEPPPEIAREVPSPSFPSDLQKTLSSVRAQRLDDDTSTAVGSSSGRPSRRIRFRDPFPVIKPPLSTRTNEEIIRAHMLGIPEVHVQWLKPKHELKQLIVAAMGQSLQRRGNACGALKVLSMNKKNQWKLARTDSFLSALIFAAGHDIGFHEKDIALDARTRAVTCLRNVCIPKENRIIVFTHPGLNECLLKVIEEDRGEARAIACAIIALLAKSPECRGSLVEIAGLVESVALVLGGHFHDTDIPFEKDEDGKAAPPDIEESTSESWESSFSGSSSTTSSNDPVSPTSHDVRSEKSLEIRQIGSIRNQREEKLGEFQQQARMNACAALLHLSKDCVVSHALCGNSSLIRNLVTVSLEVQNPIHTKCIEILLNLTLFPGNNAWLTNFDGVVETLVAAADSSELGSKRILALRALQNLSSDPASKPILAGTYPVLSLMASGAMRPDPAEKEAAVATLYNICTEPSALVAITSTKNVVATLVHLAHNPESTQDIRFVACEALATIGLWLQTLAKSGRVPEGVQTTALPSHKTYGWERWD